MEWEDAARIRPGHQGSRLVVDEECGVAEDGEVRRDCARVHALGVFAERAQVHAAVERAPVARRARDVLVMLSARQSVHEDGRVAERASQINPIEALRYE